MFISRHVHYFSLINIAALAGMAYWMIDEGNPHPSIIFPMFLGLIMVPMNNSLRDKNKQIIKVATVVSFLVLLSLIYPAYYIFLEKDQLNILQIVIMVTTTVVSLVGLMRCVQKTKNNLI